MAGFLAACSVLVLAVLGLGPHTGRYQVVTILSGSMGATAPAGAVAFSTPMPTGAVRVGDVITYSIPVERSEVARGTAGRVVTHRVVEVVEAGDAPVVRTRGDANEAVDPWLARRDPGVAWKVRFSVPWLGHGLSFLRRPAVQLLLVRTIPFLVAVLWLKEIWGWSARRPRRTRPRPPFRWTPAATRASVLCVALAGPLIVVDHALGSFSTSRTAAPSLTSATLQPASGLNASGACDLIILGAHVNLSWTATPSTWATGYRLERWRNGALEQTYLIPGAATTSYTASDVAGSRTYTFKLTAYKQGWTSTTVEKTVNTPFCLL